MKSILPMVGAIVLMAGLVAGWVRADRARAREQGRIEVLTVQRDSALEVLDVYRDSVQAAVDSLTNEVETADSVRRSFARTRPRVDSILTTITDTVVRATIDTLRMECDACAASLRASILRSGRLDEAWQRERREHNATRALLARLQDARKPPRIFFAITAGVGAVYDGRVRAGPGLMFGLTVRF